MSIRTISPNYMDLSHWADAMVQNVDKYGNLGRLMGDDWKMFGLNMMTLPALSGSVVPDPYAFDTWQEWVSRLNENLSLVP